METMERHKIYPQGNMLPPISDLLRTVPPRPAFLYARHAERAQTTIPNSLFLMPIQQPDSAPQYAGRRSPWREMDLRDGTSDHSLTGSLSSVAYSTTAPASISSSAGEDDSGGFALLRNLLRENCPDMEAIRQCISEILDDTVRPAHNQGWYRPCSSENQFAAELEPWIRGQSMNELVETYYKRDPSRATYGERVTIPRRTGGKEKSQSPEMGTGMSEEEVKRDFVKDPRGHGVRREKTHAEKEQERRTHHRELQKEGDFRSPDIVVVCGIEHADKMKETNTQRAKGPGKYEQLCMAILSQELGGRVVQSEHDGRLRAERIVWMLADWMLRQTLSRPGGNHCRPCARLCEHQPTERKVNQHARKRGQDEIEEDKVYSWRDVHLESDSDSSIGSRKRYRSLHHPHPTPPLLQSMPPSPATSSESTQPRMVPGGLLLSSHERHRLLLP